MAFAAVATYANSLGNGFAFDDNWFIVLNDVVTEARYSDAFTEPAWPGAHEGTGNYRPVQLSSFALEWSLWGGSTVGFHVVSVAAHVGVSLLVLALLSHFVALEAALVGVLFFAVHPVHVEAVANVMGRSELYAALGYLGACLVYLDLRGHGARERGVRLFGIVVLFLFALGSKEIAVTLPGALVVLEWYRRDDTPAWPRIVREASTYVAVIGVLACYVLVRWTVLGDLTGESAAPGLLSLDGTGRYLTALTVWPHYLRLMVFPLDLSVDYAPAVLLTTTTMTAEVILGGLLLLGAISVALLLRRDAPAAALGFAWFVVAISPVSNLVVRSDILLAERTLYLPSVGAAFVVAAIGASVVSSGTKRMRKVGLIVAIVGGALLLSRTVLRNPTWLDTYTALGTLAVEHPESWLGQRTRATGLTRVGAYEEAAAAYEIALELAPDHYQLLVDAGVFYDDIGRADRSEELLARATALLPGHPAAYRRLAEHRLLRGEGRAAHAIALTGLARVGADRELWALVSESYVAKSDLEAAVRARLASIARDPTVAGWTRLSELLEAMDGTSEAEDARREAIRLRPGRGGAD